MKKKRCEAASCDLFCKSSLNKPTAPQDGVSVQTHTHALVDGTPATDAAVCASPVWWLCACSGHMALRSVAVYPRYPDLHADSSAWRVTVPMSGALASSSGV